MPQQLPDMNQPFVALLSIESSCGDYEVGEDISPKTPKHAKLHWLNTGLIGPKTPPTPTQAPATK